MTILTQQDINYHCARLNISRENLTKFIIPHGITKIGEGAFERCPSLTSITIPGNVTTICKDAFEDVSHYNPSLFLIA